MLYNVILSVRSGNDRMCSGMCDLSRFWLSGLGPLVSLISKIFKLCGFQMFMLWVSLMKVITETRCTRAKFDIYGCISNYLSL